VPEANPLVRVGLRDPHKCQHAGGCSYRAVTGSTLCPLHGGASTALAAERREVRNIILQGEMGTRAEEMRRGGRLKDLTDEVILARVVLEGLARNIKSPTDYVIFSDKLMNVMKTTQGLVESLQKLQEKNRELVDRTTLFTIAEGILGVIAQYITDPDNQRAAGEDIYAIIIKGLGGEVPGQSEST
jgi:hypothetical protein